MSVLHCTLKLSISQPSNFWSIPTTFDVVFLPKRQFSNEIFWCLETKLWSKVIFCQCVHGYPETSVWFDHVTDCYCSGKRNSNKFFSNYKFASFVQSHPILMGWLWTTLVVFVWQKHMRNEPVVFAFGKERLQWFKFVILDPWDYGNQFYLEKTLKIVQCCPTWRFLSSFETKEYLFPHLMLKERDGGFRF